MARRQYKLINGILDDQVYDVNGRNAGKVDGIIVVVRRDKPPRVQAIESGFAVLAARIGRPLERLVVAIGRGLGVRKHPRYRIDWSHVTRIEPLGIHLDLDCTRIEIYAWERWLREHVIRRIPFAR
jgi:hypothetical protein